MSIDPQELCSVVREAGNLTKEVYDRGSVDVELKEDRSPLTEADRLAHEFISTQLNDLTPDIPVLSEESGVPPMQERRGWQRYWLVDPLDGTKEFIKRTGDFTINIALIENNHPTMGFVYAPVVDELYYAHSGNAYANDDQPISTRQLDPKNVIGLKSRSHASDETDLLKDRFEVKWVPMGSSLKICHVAAGQADFYPRLKPTSEWDIAAAQAILEAAGGQIKRGDGRTLAYNKADILNPSFVAFGDSSFPWQDIF